MRWKLGRCWPRYPRRIGCRINDCKEYKLQRVYFIGPTYPDPTKPYPNLVGTGLCRTLVSLGGQSSTWGGTVPRQFCRSETGVSLRHPVVLSSRKRFELRGTSCFLQADQKHRKTPDGTDRTDRTDTSRYQLILAGCFVVSAPRDQLGLGRVLSTQYSRGDVPTFQASR